MPSKTAEGDRLLLTSVQPCRHFSLAEIQSATQDFDTNLIIGQGGFGKVYKGCIYIEETSHAVAIKRLDSISEQGAPEFRAEIEMLSKLCHFHLVSLIGFCDDKKEMILVYAYISNGTLHHHLHKSETPLNWLKRLKIAVGAGRGLDYLHTGVGTQQIIIHRDVKSSNILLDENLEAMISDFGLSKIGPTNQSSSYVDASVKGTFGYLDPEYYYTRKLTRKTDVYAFGVVLFELLSGRLAVDERNGDDQYSLVRWAQRCVNERKLDQMVDSNIKGTVSPKCLRGFAKIVYRCTHSAVKKRPTMAEVVVSLQTLLEVQQMHNDLAEPSGITGFTWMIQKYLVSENYQYNDKNAIEIFHRESVATDLRCFTYHELRRATNDFKNRHTYGFVYKGWMRYKGSSWLPVAVKRIFVDKPPKSRGPPDHMIQPRSQKELDLDKFKEFHHPNLVKLIGYCMEVLGDKELLLVYEDMPNGDFEKLLYSGGVARLRLVTKVKIAVGIARGIVFLYKTQNQVATDHPWHAPVSESGLDRDHILLDEINTDEIPVEGLDSDFRAKLSGYDITKVVDGGYTYNETFCWNIEYLPGREPSKLHCNLSGFRVVFAELLTGKYISDEDEFEEINDFFIKLGKTSLVDIAKLCFVNCDEVDSESKMLRILEEYEKYIQKKNWQQKLLRALNLSQALLL